MFPHFLPKILPKDFWCFKRALLHSRDYFPVAQVFIRIPIGSLLDGNQHSATDRELAQQYGIGLDTVRK